MKLWRRKSELTVGTTRITGLRISFRCKSDLQAEPNTAEVRVWNLSPETRSKMQERPIAMLLMAGYEEGMGQVFLGEVRDVSHRKESADLITTILSGDGDGALRSRINLSLAAGARVGDALEAIANKLGVGTGGALDKLRKGDIRGGLKEFVNGTVLSGSGWKELDRLIKSTGLEASIQGGQLQVLERGKATQDDAVLLTPQTGLIGSPEAGQDGEVRLRSLLQPGIYPGRKIKIESFGVKGLFRAQSVEHAGDTHGSDWYTEIEARPLT
jgi:hypothetical protein